MLSCGVALMLAGCATTRQYENTLRKWEGRKASELVKKWGPPRAITTLTDGGKMMMFIRTSSSKMKVRKLGSIDKKVVTLRDCKTIFLVDREDKILGWKYEGHNCRD